MQESGQRHDPRGSRGTAPTHDEPRWVAKGGAARTSRPRPRPAARRPSCGGVQRPGRLRGGLGALPRLPRGHGAGGPVRAALPRRRLRLGGVPGGSLGCGGRHRRDRVRRGAALDPQGAAYPSRWSCRPSRSSPSSCWRWPGSRSSTPRTCCASGPTSASPSWVSIALALSLALLAYTGLETIVNFAAEVRQPGLTLPRTLFARDRRGGGANVAVSIVGLSASRACAQPHGPDGVASALGTEWLQAPLAGIAQAIGARCRSAGRAGGVRWACGTPLSW